MIASPFIVRRTLLLKCPVRKEYRWKRTTTWTSYNYANIRYGMLCYVETSRMNTLGVRQGAEKEALQRDDGMLMK